ncbi:hypothetical protein PpBr36_01368 [Pyricularia pennisetigena]|uniref:hypothetical protein n=1 Tax=Pyricularia pennisetigena TaxID=1578925 RepID=UPI00114FB265|nr:hypothetical protein PpBr36_01368 [Pyricularia pennisetigena]TLS29458.1 hypothetical protein PpBr36_01368 [Pyricularia pennisetigena]
MPFHDFVIRRPTILSGRISKPYVPPSGRQFNTLRMEKSNFPTKPQVITEESRQNIQIKIEPVDDCDGDYEPRTGVVGLSFHDDQGQLRSSIYEESDHDKKQSILPSIERSPSPESTDALSKQQELSPFFNLISGLRGGSGRSTPSKKVTPRKVTPRKVTRQSTGPVVSLDNAVTFPASYNSNIEWIIPKEVETAYKKLKDAIKDSTKWTASEAELHKLLALRGYHPLLPGQWKRDFYGYNLDEVLFAPLDCQLPTVLRNVSTGNASQFRATRALTGIFALSSRVADELKLSPEGGDKAANLIETEIRQYLNWAEKDAGLDGIEYPTNVGVYRVYDTERGLDALVAEMDSLMHEWTAGYTEWYTQKNIKNVPQTLFGLFILQHLVLVLTNDVKKPTNPARCMAQLDLSRSDNRWLDHALNLAIPINMARDIKLFEVVGNSNFSPTTAVTGADPDA